MFSVANFLQSQLLLDAFNKDRAALLMAQGQPAPAVVATMGPPPDPKTQELINEKLKKAEELGSFALSFFTYILLETPVMCPSSLYNPLECHNITHSSSHRKVFSDKTTNLPLQLGERQGVNLPSFEENYLEKNRKYTLILCWVTLIVIFKFLFVLRVGFAREIMKMSLVGLISVASPL